MISSELFLVLFSDVFSQSFSENLGISKSILRGLYFVDKVTVLGWSSVLFEYGVDIALGSLKVEGLKFPNMTGAAGISGPKVTLFRVRRGRLSIGWASSSEDEIPGSRFSFFLCSLLFPFSVSLSSISVLF